MRAEAAGVLAKAVQKVPLSNQFKLRNKSASFLGSDRYSSLRRFYITILTPGRWHFRAQGAVPSVAKRQWS